VALAMAEAFDCKEKIFMVSELSKILFKLLLRRPS